MPPSRSRGPLVTYLCFIVLVIKMKAPTVVQWRGGEMNCPVYDDGSELRKGGELEEKSV